MDLLRFITAGSVDDGKSTFIGRLLYDSKNICEDQLDLLQKQSKNKNVDGIDLALLTDGLKAEREQGITIDVAYRYFSTLKRKFIIADAPGHVQYTRNMITGASNSDLMVILIDARIGIIEQTRRHSVIASLLKIKHLVIAINKMDLVEYSEEVFNRIKSDFEKIAIKLNLKNITYIPISALKGENIINKSLKMEWFNENTFLEYLENVRIDENINLDEARFQVQLVIRPQIDNLHDYRGYAGKILSGIYRKGDKITVLPSGYETVLDKIEISGCEVEEAFAQQSVVMHTKDNLDISRGCLIIKSENKPLVENEVELFVCWFDEKPLSVGNKYILQQNSRTLRIVVKELMFKLDINSLNEIHVEDQVKMNEVTKVKIKSMEPIVYDKYEKLNQTGRAILIDEVTNRTVGACLF